MTVAFDAKRWRELPAQSLEDLWLIDKRGGELPFALEYEALPGGFVPEIPYWLMLRYTKPGWTVYDPMSGAMVTRRVGDVIARDVISVDLVDRGPEDDMLYQELILADARTYDPGPVDMIVWHPPYRDVITFAFDEADLSSMETDEYWAAARECLQTFERNLVPDRVCAIVIGNVYKEGRVIPLPAEMATAVAEACPGWRLKGWVVKDIQGNRQGQDGLWSYRAATADSFVFRHEVILIYHKQE